MILINLIIHRQYNNTGIHHNYKENTYKAERETDRQKYRQTKKEMGLLSGNQFDWLIGSLNIITYLEILLVKQNNRTITIKETKA